MPYNRRKILGLLLIYVLFLVTGALSTLASAQPVVPKPFSYQLGQILGVLALSSLPIQLLLASRIRILERGIGLGRIMRWHNWNARFLTVFVILHPVLIFLGPILGGISVVGIIKSLNFYHWLGITTLILIFFTIGITVLSEKIRLNYEDWKVVHRVGYVIVVLGFIHSYFVGSDIVARRPLFYWWLGLAVLALSALAYRYILRPWRFRKNWYEVVEVIAETQNVRSIYLEPCSQLTFDHAPGQFAFVTFESGNLPREEHHFTVSSAPGNKRIAFTIKELGDFTSALGELRVGDRVKIEGPYGVFSNLGMKGPFVFIAGGIGITPIMSMLRFMRDTDQTQESLLIYANRARADIVFFEELERLNQSEDWFRLVHILSEEKTEGFYYGHVNRELLRKEIADLTTPVYFVVGPLPMMKLVKGTLTEMGVSGAQILTERFALR